MTRSMTMPKLAALLSCAWVLAGCGRLKMEDVPSHPIAFVRAQVSEGLLRLDDFKQALRGKYEIHRAAGA